MVAPANSSYNGQMVTIQEYALEIARGRVPGAEPFGAFGEFVASGGEINHVIWPNGAYKYPNAAGAQVKIRSTSLNDTIGGTGVEKIEVHYLTTALEPATLIVNMNGTTYVTTDENGDLLPDFRFFQCVHAHVIGTVGGSAAGAITVEDVTTGDTYALVAAGDTRCASSGRMVPAGKRAVVYGLAAGSISLTADAGTIVRVAATEFDTHQYTDQGLFIPFGSSGVQNNSLAYTLPIPGIFNPGTVIAMTCSPEKAATITGDWFGWTEDL